MLTLAFGLIGGELFAAPLGDLDGDGVFTAIDLAKLVAYTSGDVGMTDAELSYADLNQDGFINNDDHTALIQLILETATPEELPLASVRSVSPSIGEADVAVTRETVFFFSMPLALGAALDTTQLHASFGGRKILSRVAISADRRKVTLFYLEPLPSNARVQVVFAPQGLSDLLGRQADVDGDGLPGGSFVTSFDTLSLSPVAGTAISGQVFASEGEEDGTDVPLVGVTVTVDGAEETLRTTTNAQGQFTLSPCPAGTFFVHIDGRTSPLSNYPSGVYYPSVGKRWDALAGRTDNLSGNSQDAQRGKIYLPRIRPGSLRAVSQSSDVPVELPAGVLADFPQMAGTRLVVPANSLFADDGTRGGFVGVAPVAPDRLPSPLPPNLQLPIVITIQTDGASNFDIPVPVCLPNLPDPVTGLTLPPGAKTALLSFNHDLGDWEVVGPMTVTEDGNFVKTDAGVGVRQPGWHGAGPGSGGGGPGGAGDPSDRNGRPSPKKPSPPCPKRSGWEWGKLVFDFTVEVASCVTQFTSVADAFKCGLGIGSSIRSTIESAGAYQVALAEGKRLDQVESILTEADAEMQRAQALMECFNAGGGALSMSKKLVDGYNCLGNVINIGDSICQFADNTDAPAPCRAGPGAQEVCAGLALAKQQHANFKAYIDLLDNIEKRLLFQTMRFAIAESKNAVSAVKRSRDFQPAPPPPPGGGPMPPPAEIILTPAEREMLAAPMRKFQEAANGFAPFSSIVENLDKGMDGFQKQADTMMANASSEVLTWGEAVENQMYYRVTVGTQVQRGKTANSGRVSLILTPNSRYTIDYYNPVTKEMGMAIGPTGSAGANFTMNAAVMRETTGLSDTDGDGLVDSAEVIVGTSSSQADTDGDGVSDGAELDQGTDPLSDLLVSTGVVASVPTSGAALDVSAVNNLAAVACGAAGVGIFNVATGVNPLHVATLDTPGTAHAVALSATYLAVADGAQGMTIIDLNDTANPIVKHQILIGGTVTSVATDGVVAFAGMDSGRVVVVDMATGTILQNYNSGSGGIEDIVLGRERLYLLKVGALLTLNVNGGALSAGSSVACAGSKGAGGRRLRLFVADSYLWTVNTRGYNVFSLANPGTPLLVQPVSTSQFGWKQLVANGSGLGIGAVSVNSTDDGAHDVNLYEVGSDGLGTNFLTTLATPGLAAALSVYNGLAYVADTGSGLQLLNYLAYDSTGVPPTIGLQSNFSLDHGAHTGLAEEGKIMRVSGAVTDNVQVRNVEFYINGTRVLVDGNFPFEHRFITPAITETQTSFLVKAKATDTGGNVTWTEEYTITLSPDATPPQVTGVVPGPNGLVGRIKGLYVSFNEAMDAGTLGAGGFQLTGLGADRVFGTADDFDSTGVVSYRDKQFLAFMTFANAGLAPGSYRLRVQSPVADVGGNQLAAAVVNDFRVYDVGLDVDLDGLPDELESLLGLDPTKQDSNNNGTIDGQEDYDNDGLVNAAEIVLGLDPRNSDSNSNGILDGVDDDDFDSLNNVQEYLAGSNRLNPDTDRDGWSDEAEVTGNGNPIDEKITPRLYVTSSLVGAVSVFKPSLDAPSGSLGLIASDQRAVSVYKQANGVGSSGLGVVNNQTQPLAVFKPAHGPAAAGSGLGGITSQPQARVTVKIQP